MKKLNNYKILRKLPLALFALSFFGLAGVGAPFPSSLIACAEAAGADPEAARLKREAQEITQRQAEAARGYADYIAARKNSPPGTSGSRPTHLVASAQSKVFESIQRLQKEDGNRVYDKVYNYEGKVMGRASDWKEPVEIANANDEEVLENEAPSPKTKSVGSNSSSGTPSSAAPGGPAPAGSRKVPAANSDTKKTQWVLDGGDVPKELTFPGAK